MKKPYVLKEAEAPPGTFRIDYQKELNAEQLDVVLHGDGPCLVLAGAGSGKTRTLVYRVAYLVEKGIPPDRILLVTFTNKAAREMLSRVEVLLRATPKGLWGGTFHHVGNRILRQYATKLGYTSGFGILDEDDATAMVKSVVAAAPDIPKEQYFPKADVLADLFSFAANAQKPIAELARRRFRHLPPSVVPIVEALAKQYVAKKRAANVLDFDDLLVQWLRLLEEQQGVRERLAGQFRYILVDEYQDTNPIQARIVRLLGSRHGNVLVVGDDAQSIYSFRAADIRNILRFPKDFPKTKTYKLETNYRSTPEILALANSAIVQNRQQFKKRLHTHRGRGTKPILVRLLDGDQQASFIAQRILELQEEGCNLREIAVLFRATAQIIELELELGKRNIPYRVRGGLRFFEQAHIKDVVAHFRILSNPRDEIAWKRVVQLQPGIGAAAAEKIWQHVQAAHDLSAALGTEPAGLTPRAAEGFRRTSKVLGGMQRDGERFIATGIAGILDASYRSYVEAAFENPEERLEDLEQLASFAAQYRNLDRFLADVTLSEGFRGERLAAEYGETDEVLLTTIHQAKGLEWKTVFILSLAQGLFPHRSALADAEELEEERRLFYVAVTRAQDELYLTYPIISSSFRTGRAINHPSVFLTELPSELYDEWEIEGVPTMQLEEEGSGETGILDRYL